jgi:phosphoribosylglycinamide formyltransferase-1
VKKKLLIMGSGNGSNFEAIISQLSLHSFDIQLFCDRPRAKILDRARRLNIPFRTIPLDRRGDKEFLWQEVREFLDQDFDLLALAGFMRILPPDIVQSHPRKIINIHPSLLPSFPGAHAIQDAYDYGVMVTGVTVHYVDEGVDTGPIIAQEPISLHGDPSLEEVEKALHEVENYLYPRVIARLLKGTPL